MNFIFTAAAWHALAKLRLHSNDSLVELRKETTLLTNLLRKFAKETAKLDVKELPREVRARQRRATTEKGLSQSAPITARTRQFNLATYKIHSLPDYAPTIEKFGTTDSWVTRLVSWNKTYKVCS